MEFDVRRLKFSIKRREYNWNDSKKKKILKNIGFSQKKKPTVNGTMKSLCARPSPQKLIVNIRYPRTFTSER